MADTPRIVFLDAATLDDLPAFAEFEQAGDFVHFPRSAEEEVVRRSAGAAVIVTNKVRVTSDMIRALPDLRLVCVAATGTNNVDKEAARARGIPVRNVAGYSTDSVAQLTLTVLLTLAMDITYLNRAVHAGDYSRAQDFCLWRRPFFELKGKAYGIIGLGSIGGRVAELATAYGAEVVYHSISGRDHDVPYRRLELGELLRISDVVSIHCALSDKTRDLLAYDELQTMKPTAHLVNVARGGIVNESDLVRALNDKLIAGAAVDVFTTEPLPDDHPYLNVYDPERLLLTPHVAWASVEARTRLIRGIIANIRQGW